MLIDSLLQPLFGFNNELKNQSINHFTRLKFFYVRWAIFRKGDTLYLKYFFLLVDFIHSWCQELPSHFYTAKKYIILKK